MRRQRPATSADHRGTPGKPVTCDCGIDCRFSRAYHNSNHLIQQSREVSPVHHEGINADTPNLAVENRDSCDRSVSELDSPFQLHAGF